MLAALEMPELPGTLPKAYLRTNLANVVLVPLGEFDAARRLLAANDAYSADKPIGSSFHWLTWCGLHEAICHPGRAHGGPTCATATDERGVARPQNGLCDIGSVERQASDDGYYLYLPFALK
jgi:hypothetical protein